MRTQAGTEECCLCARLGQASCPEECAVALEAAAAAVADTLAWHAKRRFLSPQQLSAWDHYVRLNTPVTQDHSASTQVVGVPTVFLHMPETKYEIAQPEACSVPGQLETRHRLARGGSWCG